MRVIAPITEETKAAGKRFAASHPELEIERYLMPKYDNAPYEPNRKEVVQAEAHGLRVQFPAAVASFRPALVVAGHETVARYMAPMGQVHGLPWVQLVRGSPTGEVLRGVYPRAGAARFLRDLGEADQIVTVAEFQADGLRNLGVANVTTIPNAIDTCAVPAPTCQRQAGRRASNPQGTDCRPGPRQSVFAEAAAGCRQSGRRRTER